MSNSTTILDPRNVERTKRPRKYAVVLFNDDFTPMEFVVEIIERIFHKSNEDAEAIAYTVHTSGRAIVDTFTYEVAETKCVQVLAEAAAAEHPLQPGLEPVA